jgi:hypothetical protein
MSREKASAAAKQAVKPGPGWTAKKPRARKHGYRGYGSASGTEAFGGAIHWGTGFGGVGAPGAYVSERLPEAGIVTVRAESVAPLAPRRPDRRRFERPDRTGA